MVHERVVASVRHMNFEHVTYDCSWSKWQKKARSPEGEIETDDSMNHGGNSSDNSASSPRPQTSRSPAGRPSQRRPSEDTTSSSSNMIMACNSLRSTSRSQDVQGVHHTPGMTTNLPSPSSLALTSSSNNLNFQSPEALRAPQPAYHLPSPHIYSQQQKQEMTAYPSPRTGTLPTTLASPFIAASPFPLFLHQQPSQPHFQQVSVLPRDLAGFQNQNSVGMPNSVQSNEVHPSHHAIPLHPQSPFNAQSPPPPLAVAYTLYPSNVGSHHLHPPLPQSFPHNQVYRGPVLQSQPQQPQHHPVPNGPTIQSTDVLSKYAFDFHAGYATAAAAGTFAGYIPTSCSKLQHPDTIVLPSSCSSTTASTTAICGSGSSLSCTSTTSHKAGYVIFLVCSQQFRYLFILSQPRR